MTDGVLIYAFNNDKTDYVGMAVWSAKNIQHHLQVPVAIVTDNSDDPRLSIFDKIIIAPAESGGNRYFEDYDSVVVWNNASRVDAYSLSPWDTTLVLDADYVVNSSQLKTLFDVKSDFMCHRYAQNLSTGELLDGLNTFGDFKMPMWWATVMLFRKTDYARDIFKCMQMVKQNWDHYRNLYHIPNRTYRNDFALSIAIGIVSGHTFTVDEIPWPLLSAMPSDKLTNNNNNYTLHCMDNEKPKYISFNDIDFHAMGKKHLENIIATN